MPIENRDLPAGTRLAVRHKKQVFTCEVVKTKDGLRYRLADGKEFNSPSSAGREVTNGVAVNGWRFWSLEGDLKERKAKEPKTKSAKKGGAKREGAFGSCDVCGKPFATQKAALDHSHDQAPAKKAAKAKGAKKAAKKSKGKSARAATKGDAYGCGACGQTFPTQKKAVAHALTHTS
jgi:RNA polymerase-binding transcription factor DksA